MRSAIAILLLLILALCGCRREDTEAAATRPATGKSQVTIGYCAPEWGGAQYQIMQGFRSRAEKLGWRCLVLNANFDPDVQARQIEYLIEIGVTAIVAVPLDSDRIVESVNKAKAAGVLFYTVDRKPSSGSVELVVQADNTLAGEQAGKYAADFLRRKYGRAKGTVLQLRGELSQRVAREREAGFLQGLGDTSEINIINRDTQWQPRLFADAVSEVVQTTDVDVIYMHSDMIGTPEVLPVLRRLGLLKPAGDDGHICIVGVDGGPPALKAVRDGVIDAVASQPLTDYGIVVHWLEKRLRGEKVQIGAFELLDEQVSGCIVEGPTGPLLQLPTVLVTRDNADDQRLWGNESVIREAPAK